MNLILKNERNKSTSNGSIRLNLMFLINKLLKCCHLNGLLSIFFFVFTTTANSQIAYNSRKTGKARRCQKKLHYMSEKMCTSAKLSNKTNKVRHNTLGYR